MKSKKNISLKRVFLRNLLVGMLLPFVIILMVIALQVFTGVQKDKEDTYLTMAQMLADNIHESVQKYVAVVETAAYNEDVTGMDADRAEAYLNQIITDSGNVWSHFLITDSDGIEIAHTDGAEHHGTSIADREYYLSPWKTARPSSASQCSRRAREGGSWQSGHLSCRMDRKPVCWWDLSVWNTYRKCSMTIPSHPAIMCLC